MFVRFTTHTPAGEIIPCTAETTIRVCDHHQKDAAEGFVGARNMDLLAAQLEHENLAVPHPASIEIEFGRLPKDDPVISVSSVREHFAGH